MRGYELKKSLRRIGMMQKDFAELCGVHHQTVYRWCNGLNPVPKYAVIIFTMEYKGVDIERKLRILVDEGRLFKGITPENCPSYSEIYSLIQEIKAIED